MKRKIVGLIAAAALATPLAGQAISIRVNMTVDNSYALFYGTSTQATTFVGADFSWPSVESYNFNLPADHYLYVVTASDLSVAQGFLGQFENLDSGYKFYSNDPQWQVMATGLGSTGAPYTGSGADLALLSSEIQDANAGGNASNGWTALTAGPTNGSAPWGLLAGIDSAARWVWYSSNGDLDPTSPGFNHDEWLVFRIAVAARPTESVPLPGTIALLCLGLAGLGLARFKNPALQRS